MPPADLDLARTLAAHPRWRWAPGMLALEQATPGMGLWRDGRCRLVEGADAPWQAVPDLTDHATAGCLLDTFHGLGRAYALIPTVDGGYTLSMRHDGLAFTGDTLGEALARALLAAWGPA